MDQADEVMACYLAMDAAAREMFRNFGSRLAQEWPAPSKAPKLTLVSVGLRRNAVNDTVNEVIDCRSQPVIAKSVHGK